jgi:hypothetical protein
MIGCICGLLICGVYVLFCFVFDLSRLAFSGCDFLSSPLTLIDSHGKDSSGSKCTWETDSVNR